LIAAASGEDGFKILVDGKQVLDQVHAEGQVPKYSDDRSERRPDRQFRPTICPVPPAPASDSGFVYEPDLISAEAKQFAKIADVVVVAIGFNTATEGEGHDRTFTLPWGQDALVEAVAAANPHTIVTLTGGGAMDTRRWLDKVPALLHTWYPGQEGGTAVAEVLFGKQNPEGKLPISFDRDWESNPSQPLLRRSRRGYHAAHNRRKRQATRLHGSSHQV
jgi:beta-glucosidase